MGGEHSEFFPLTRNKGVDNAARLAAGKADVMKPKRADLGARQQRVAELGLAAPDGGAGNAVKAGSLEEIIQLIRFFSVQRIEVDLLQTDNVRFELSYQAGDTLRIAPPVNPHTLVNVI
jgi:hypothetical protein